MPYVCKDCGNIEEFKGNQRIIENAIVYGTFDGDGDLIDESDRDVDDTDIEDTDIDECVSCGSGNVYWADDEEQAKKMYEDEQNPQTIKELISK